MELNKLFSCGVLVILAVGNDVFGFQLAPSKSSEKAVFGDNDFKLDCLFDLSPGEVLLFLRLERQRNSSGAFERVITFATIGNTTYQDTSLVSRTQWSLTPVSASSSRASLEFNNIVCSDNATYRWFASYLDSSGAQTMEKTITVPVMAMTTFTENTEPGYTPSASLKEGDDVTFTCTGDVGEAPRGVYKWLYYLSGSTTGGVDITNKANTKDLEFNDTSCSWRQTSSLVLKMLKEYNGIVVRCAVEQEQTTKYRQTNGIEVQYGPGSLSVLREPMAPVYYTGDMSLNMTCSADANPPATYYWVTTRGNITNVTEGAVYHFTDLMEEDTGEYVCVAYNTINMVNYTMNYTASIEVRMTTTTSTTTTTTPSSTAPNNVSGNPGDSTDGGDDGGGTNNLGGIIGGVIAAIVVVVVIIVIVLCLRKHKKKPEIEEPPEKPRNNQGLTYYGNRPDLVTSDLKNNQQNLNTSFSNSYDSSSDIKPRNDDGLNYAELQIEDKPRSRRPIQMFDLEPGYTDLSLPRV